MHQLDLHGCSVLLYRKEGFCRETLHFYDIYSLSHLFTASIPHGAQRCFEPLALLVFDFGVAGQLLLVLPCEIFPERLELLLLLLVPLCPLLGQHGSVTVLLLLAHPLHLLHLVSLQLAYL